MYSSYLQGNRYSLFIHLATLELRIVAACFRTRLISRGLEGNAHEFGFMEGFMPVNYDRPRALKFYWFFQWPEEYNEPRLRIGILGSRRTGRHEEIAERNGRGIVQFSTASLEVKNSMIPQVSSVAAGEWNRRFTPLE